MNGLEEVDAPHVPVMLDEVVGLMRMAPPGRVVDATLGAGGHAIAIATARRDDGSGGVVLGIDRDPDALELARQRFAGVAGVELTTAQVRFDHLAEEVEARGWPGVAGILVDLGVSSMHLDRAERGFSYRTDGPLDMRMGPDAPRTAAQLLEDVDVDDLARILRDYGEERHARRIARAIVAARLQAPLTTTRQLAAIVAAAQPRPARRPSRGSGRGSGQASGARVKHPATRSFQAIRMHINAELQALDAALEQAPEVLAGDGRLAVISFHSLEDRRVKRFMRARSRGPTAPRGMPVVLPGNAPVLRTVGRAMRACDDEIRANPRARSAVLRIAARLA